MFLHLNGLNQSLVACGEGCRRVHQSLFIYCSKSRRTFVVMMSRSERVYNREREERRVHNTRINLGRFLGQPPPHTPSSPKSIPVADIKQSFLRSHSTKLSNQTVGCPTPKVEAVYKPPSNMHRRGVCWTWVNRRGGFKVAHVQKKITLNKMRRYEWESIIGQSDYNINDLFIHLLFNYKSINK